MTSDSRPAGTSGPVVLETLGALAKRARVVAARGGRRVVGVAGSPGAGKTTLVTTVVAALAQGAPEGWVAHVPMDGFHLADAELRRLGLLDRKGAPETFDARGYAALLERLRSTTDHTVYAPAFDREIEQPVAGAIPVLPACRLVLTEGNYLLLDEDDWRRARSALDEVWFCEADEELRRAELLARHVQFGKSPGAADSWVREVDERNAERVAATRARADVVVPRLVLS